MGIRDRLRSAPRRLASATEHWRVRSHLWRAERRLRHRTDDDPDRLALLDRLREYRRAGAYPTNTMTTDRSPVFRDESGTRCAVGDLAVRTGHADVVDAVVERDNTVDLSSDDPPAPLAAWLADSPLSREEAALVQPSYGGGTGTIVRESCSMLSCTQVKFLVVSWALVSLFLLEGVAYLLLDRFAVATSAVSRGAALGTVALVGVAVLAVVTAVVVLNVRPATVVGSEPIVTGTLVPVVVAVTVPR